MSAFDAVKLKAAAAVLMYDGATVSVIEKVAGQDALGSALVELFDGGWLARFDAPGRETVWYWAAEQGYDALWSSLRSDPCPMRFVGLGRPVAA